MALQSGVGISTHRNPVQAGREAAQAAMKQAGIASPDLVVLFATTGYEQQAVVRAAREATGRATLVGCSAEGIISSAGSVEDSFAVLCAVIKSSDVRFTAASATRLSVDSRRAGETVGGMLKPYLAKDALGVLLFPDGLTLNFDQLSAGLLSTLAPPSFLPLFGGSAGDNWELKKTYQYHDDQVLTDSVVCALMCGSAKLAWSVNHGCASLGAERRITRAKGNTIYEIDGRPALDVFKEYLQVEERENWGRAVVNLTLGFAAPSELSGQDELVVRFVPQKNEQEGSVSISTEVTEGTPVWIARRDYDKISAGLDRIGAQIGQQLEGHKPGLVFHFDCAGRGKVIFRDDEKQTLFRQLQRQVAPETPWIGFHSYGEIGPVGKKNAFHNYTAVVLALTE